MFILSTENKNELIQIKEKDYDQYIKFINLYNNINKIICNVEELGTIEERNNNLYLNREFNFIIHDTHLTHTNYKYKLYIHLKTKQKDEFRIDLTVQGFTYKLYIDVFSLKETISEKTRTKIQNLLYKKIVS